MEEEKNVKGIIISKDLETIDQIVVQNEEEQDPIEKEGMELIDTIKPSLTQLNQRESVSGELGLWFCERKELGCYLLLANFDYPERIGYKLLDEAMGAHNDH